MQRQKTLTPLVEIEKPQILNLNTATPAELEKLPEIGEDLARRIVEYRNVNGGKFRRVEELLLLRGMSEKKFRSVAPFLKVE